MSGPTIIERGQKDFDAVNRTRFRSGDDRGHYESWFQRANHPTRRLAFWIRYTIFSPKDRPDSAIGELWAIFFDGERNRMSAVREVVPLSQCRFSADALDVAIGESTLDARSLRGVASSPQHRIEWSLEYDGGQPPLLLLPHALYERPFPRAKALVGSPNARFRGTVTAGGETHEIDGWSGSQNHNWGSRHTDSYAWGQVAGFDDDPDAFLECSTAQLRIGPIWTPRMSLVVLRVDGEEHALNTLGQAVRANGDFRFFDWTIDSRSAALRIALRIHAASSDFVALTYGNPPGGTKTCLNTKLAACEVTLERRGRSPRNFRSAHRAAFEILTDRGDHGIPLVV